MKKVGARISISMVFFASKIVDKLKLNLNGAPGKEL